MHSNVPFRNGNVASVQESAIFSRASRESTFVRLERITRLHYSSFCAGEAIKAGVSNSRQPRASNYTHARVSFVLNTVFIEKCVARLTDENIASRERNSMLKFLSPLRTPQVFVRCTIQRRNSSLCYFSNIFRMIIIIQSTLILVVVQVRVERSFAWNCCLISPFNRFIISTSSYYQ